MKAVIKLDVPDWQIGQEVSVYFKDTMMKKGICEKACGRWKDKTRLFHDMNVQNAKVKVHPG